MRTRKDVEKRKERKERKERMQKKKERKERKLKKNERKEKKFKKVKKQLEKEMKEEILLENSWYSKPKNQEELWHKLVMKKITQKLRDPSSCS